MKKIFVYFFTMILVQAVVSLLGGFVLGMSSGILNTTAMQLIVASSVSNLIVIAIFVLAKWTPFSREYINQRPWAALLWCIVIALGMLIPSQFIEELLPESMRTDILAEQLKMVMANSWGYIAVGLMAPLAEELVFRGAIQKTAIKYFEKKFANSPHPNLPHWTGIVFTAVLFAAIHGNPAQMPHAFLVGLLLGWLCYRSGSIIPGIVVHWVNNSISFLITALYPETYEMTIQDLLFNNILYIVLAILLSLFLFAVGIYQFHVRTKMATQRHGDTE